MLIELPTAWRLENYANENIVIWFTGASAVGCTNGRLAPDSAMSAQDRSRLWSLVLSAKLSNRKVGLSYSGTGNACVITSFFID
ncbi:hypothetical protein [Caulobacter sp. UNC279MFTsu5.1]|uniref:hypothetical protein n=1 Tax=Caulobacter sp. UNC279MFTsu5.1 TaxID=1502775 RepID=UPI001160C9D9|nr:hypothetical protein [Caulobacter sp. UNC279MFTsu5.1]